MNKFEEIKKLISSLEDDATKFYDKKNGSAGARLRAGLMDIKTLAQEGRNEVSAIKNAGKGDN